MFRRYCRAWIVQFDDNPVMLIRFDWATKKWPDRYMQARFDEMRDVGMTLGVSGSIYLILHRKPVIVDRWAVRRQYADDLGERSEDTRQ